MNILLEQEEDNDKETKIEEKTSNKFDLKYRTNLSQIEGFVANDSFTKTAEDKLRDVRSSTSVKAFLKLPTTIIKMF